MPTFDNPFLFQTFSFASKLYPCTEFPRFESKYHINCTLHIFFVFRNVLYLEMIQNFSHKHALLIAQCVCRNSPPGKRSSLFYPPYPHRHKFSTEANFRGSYFYLMDIDWSCFGWSNILALLSSTVFHLSRSSWGNRWKNDERPEGGGKCLSLFAAFPPRPRETAPVTY